MRTTVELSDPLYRRVRALAATRGERGFSPIVEVAVREYLDREARGGANADEAFAAARGAWTDNEAEQLSAEIRDVWATWTPPPS